MTVQVCIIDDNKTDITKIRNEISLLCSDDFDPNIASLYKVDSLSSIPYSQIYFIDIDMPKFDGFTVAKYILNRNKNSHIIFVTNRDDLVFDSFDFDTFYFVRKSTLKTDITRSIKKYLRTLTNNDFIVINYNHDIYQINKSDIVWIESKGNNLNIHTNQFELNIRKTLKSLLVELNNINFIKIHNSFLVNLNYVQRIHKNTCYLSNGITLPISSLKKKQLQNIIKNRKDRL